MASTSSSSTCAPTHYEYDVFLSFRGEDTRFSFTDHLYKALHQAGISTFRDDDEIREGQELKPEIERSITQSSASIIVISENFANSRWCLDELSLILRQKRKGGHFVLPVFYGVDVSDVRNQRGSFTIQAKEGSKWTRDNVNRWKAALTEVADLKGMVVSGYETTFIRNIVQKIHSELGLKLCSTPTGLTGIETRAEPITSWLNNEKPDSPVLAICGMGGSGKTTLAKHVYYSNKNNFDGCSLLEDILKHPDGLLGVQKKLLRDISINNTMKISNVYEGALQLKKAIRMNKVLLVVDDIDEKDILSTLFGTEVFPTQSKIIITTRIQNIDTWHGSISCGCHVHKVELLNDPESLELLSFHAFGSKFPMEGFEELALQLAQYCGGNPLALKVLGSSLPVSAQERSNMIGVWRSKINSLISLKGDLDNNIQCVLQKSFESLPCEENKELFLYIACFFVGQYASHVERILESDYHAKSGMVTLIDRCLLTVSRNGPRLVMHKLLQAMARKIVRNEFKDPAKRRRVWHHVQSDNLLRSGDGSETIEGLLVKMGKVEQWMTSEAFKTSSLVMMKHTGSYANFPNLRCLIWPACYLKTIPPGLLTSRLVALFMPFGNFEEFDPPMVLNSLKILDLSYSNELVSICNLHRLPKLEDLVLIYCDNLTHVCKTIGDLENLSFLRLSGCTRLWKASSNQMFVNLLERLKALCTFRRIPEQPLCFLRQSLSTLILHHILFQSLSFMSSSGCTKLWKASSNQMFVNQLERLRALCIFVGVPEHPLCSLSQPLSISYLNHNLYESLSFWSLLGCIKLWKASSNQVLCTFRRIPEQPLCSSPQPLFTLILDNMLFEILPSYINLKRLRTLVLSDCSSLKSLPSLPRTLERLYVDRCSSLEMITFQSACFTLKVFNYECCFKLCEIEGLFKLVSIEKLEEADLGHMQWIKAYQYHKVDLVGDQITNGRTFNIQMLYEYGLRSAYLQGIKDQSMATHENTSALGYPLSFRVPLHPEKHRIQGLNVTLLYRSLGEDRNPEFPRLFASISNRSKGITWVYSPVVSCKPRVHSDVVWLSYWPIGNTLDTGDEVYVEILAEEGIITSGIGASLVYMDGGEVEKEEEKSEEEVIGGDLSGFEVTKGGYYLCRKNFFDSMIPDCFFGDNIQITDSRRWRTSSPLKTFYHEEWNGI